MSECGAVAITVPGDPVAWERTRYNSRTRHFFKADASREFTKRVQLFASARWEIDPLDCAVELVVDIFREIPKSWSGRRKESARAQKILPITKPDLDNYVKAIKDALNGIVYRDDALVVTERSTKRYSDNPRAVIHVSWGHI